MDYDFESCAATHGTFNVGYAVVAVCQNAYIGLNPHNIAENVYISAGIDIHGNTYEILWEIINPESEDENDACDWENPISIRKE